MQVPLSCINGILFLSFVSLSLNLVPYREILNTALCKSTIMLIVTRTLPSKLFSTRPINYFFLLTIIVLNTYSLTVYRSSLAGTLPSKPIQLTDNKQGNYFYIDPANGSENGDGSLKNPWKTLQQVVDMGLIETYRPSISYKPESPLKIINQGAPVRGGDTLILKSGYHGYVKTNSFLFKDWLHICAAPNEHPVLAGIRLNGAIQKLHIKGLTFLKDSYSPSPGSDDANQPYWRAPLLNRNASAIIQISSSKFWGKSCDIIIEQNYIATTKNVDKWSKEDWLKKAADGIYIREVQNARISNNTIVNTRHAMGIDYRSDHSEVINNTIKYFSGDGIRISSNDLLIQNNVITDCVKVNNHHDDGIQGWSRGESGKAGKGTLKNVIIKENTIIGTTDWSNPFPGAPQGLGFFDGFYDNFTVERNLIVTNTYHGISFYGLQSSKILNNTVVDQVEGDKFSPWIMIHAHKRRGNSSNNLVYNNIAHRQIVIESDNSKIENNFIIGHKRYGLLNSLFISPDTYNYHIQPNKITKKHIIHRGKPLDNMATAPSLGAFEYKQ